MIRNTLGMVFSFSDIFYALQRGFPHSYGKLPNFITDVVIKALTVYVKYYYGTKNNYYGTKKKNLKE